MTEPEGVWIRWCEPCKWLSPTLYRYADVMRSAGEHHSKVGARCFTRTVGRLPYGTGAAVLAARLPDWAQEIYWARTGERALAALLGEDAAEDGGKP